MLLVGSNVTLSRGLVLLALQISRIPEYLYYQLHSKHTTRLCNWFA